MSKSSVVKSLVLPVAFIVAAQVACDRKSGSTQTDTPTPKPTKFPLAGVDPVARQVITDNCISCHQAGKSAEEYAMTSDEQVFAIRKEIVAALNVEKCVMPPRKPDVCQSENVQALARWAASSLAAPTPTPTPESTPMPTAEPTPVGTPEITPTAEPTPTQVMFDDVKPILDAKCGSCHNAPKPGEVENEAHRNYPMDTKEQVIEIRSDIVRVLRPERCRMPLGEERKTFCLTDDAKKLSGWAASDAQ